MPKDQIIKYLPPSIVGITVLMLLSLHYGWLNPFFFDAEHAHVQGIDYFALPKSYLNLLAGRSLFDTWGGAPYGPYATWYLAHPAFSIFIASWFSFFQPWTGYWLFVLFTLALLALSAYFISETTDNLLYKRLGYLFLLCTFPTYWLLYVGNMHGPTILSLSLIFVSIFQLTYAENNDQINAANARLAAGLLISFFTKPIVFLMLPLLLLTKETRKTTVKCIIFYGVVSLIFIFVPVFNPQGVGLKKLMDIAFDSDFIKQNLNVYKNHYVLNEYMKDNSIHWLNLIAQSEYKLMHIDVFSLPVFLDTILGKEINSVIYKIPIYITMILSVATVFIKNKRIRLESTLLLLMAISLTFFLSYNTIWEYQFTSVLPIIAMLPMLKEIKVYYGNYIMYMLPIGLFICLPSLFFLNQNADFGAAGTLTLIRFTRIVPVLLIFLLMIYCLIDKMIKNTEKADSRTENTGI